MESFDELKELGLDESEIKIYLACLSETGSNVLEISKKAGIIRTTTYGLLQSLVKKGLVSSIKKENVMVFRAISPKELINMLNEKKNKVLSILPKLEEISKTTKTNEKVDYFEGKQAIKTITNDTISVPNQIVKVLGAGKKWIDFSSGFAMNYYLRKKEANVKTKTILSNTNEEKEFVKEKIAKNSEFKFLDGEDISNVAAFIYRDKVAFVNYSKENARGFIVQDKEFNRVQNILFDNLWKLAKK